MDSGIRVEYTRLVCQQHAQRVPYTTGKWPLNALALVTFVLTFTTAAEN